MKLNRRSFLRGGLAAAAGAATLPFAHLFRPSDEGGPYGPLVPDPDGLLDLPKGFSYRVLERRHDPMDDGYRVPGRPDGMACFEAEDGRWVLLRNHELGIDDTDGPYRDGQRPPPQAYAERGMGGVTRVVIDPGTGEHVSSNLVLTGTSRNCAGGPSPWGWLSCEESVESGHGYVFVCRPDAGGVAAPHRVPAYGRFRHEAVAIDPQTATAYLTEDRSDGALYRFVPRDPQRPFEDGRLQAMRVRDDERFDTGRGLRAGDRLPVDWVDLDEPDPPGDTLRAEAQDKGAALVRRGEGAWWAEGAAYVCATSGGPFAAGQVFRYRPRSGGDGGQLELVAQSDDRAELEMPDNITVAPSGDLYVAEDGLSRNHIRMIRSDGTVSAFACNTGSGSELAGLCFSPDGRVLFVNVQHDGLTLSITGPFDAPKRPAAA